MAKAKREKNYYGEEQELAVVQFLDSTSPDEKEKIYRLHLQEPINIMIESIIRKYKLYRASYEFVDIHADTLSFLITKFDKFKPEKGTKSYSYFGTVCRNYLFGEMIKEYKKNLKITEIDNVPTKVWGRDDLTYRIDDDVIDMNVFIEGLIDELKLDIRTKNLNENEFKVGHSLVKILEEWKTLFADNQSGKNSPKFNKNLILFYIRDMTGLTTKEIRNGMKRFKGLYRGFKNDLLND